MTETVCNYSGRWSSPLKCYYLGDKKITEAEAKEIEAKNREILRDGTIEELLQIRFVVCLEE
jgi:hypothetical protein